MGTPKVLIIGIGNLLWADEGFGVRAIEAMHRLYEWPENVRLMDGGTQGLYLVQHVREADILIVFDAVDYGLQPGTIKLVEGAEVPKFLGAKKISLHQTGFQEVLATAELLGGATQHLYLIGVQPVELDDFGGSLRDEMKARIAPAIQHAIDFLARFGISGRLRDVPLPEAETLACEHMVMSRYEAQRPSAEDACRFGDPRVLVMAEQAHGATADQQPTRTPGAQ
ncbi:HyaD/HybD family hydrogenase maturation endopeptidase [Bradyrhizobium sp.]|uniref:HyaD/HybD family hydrogenase maturation endopeptidase n=1 Tax=Bradyrhizobium sp. TaxID=376 RepID=UPI003C7782A5